MGPAYQAALDLKTPSQRLIARLLPSSSRELAYTAISTYNDPVLK